ncbi:MAG: SRPBCC family protein [Rhodanobacteraceae bacterium]
MPTYRVTENIAAPAARVWASLRNVLAWPEWLPTVTSVTPLGVSNLEIGARFRVLQPKLRPATWEVVSVREGQGFVWQAGSPGLAMSAGHVVEPTGPESCKLTLEFTFSGRLSPLAGLLAGSLTRRYIATEAASLKVVAEADGSPVSR